MGNEGVSVQRESRTKKIGVWWAAWVSICVIRERARRWPSGGGSRGKAELEREVILSCVGVLEDVVLLNTRRYSWRLEASPPSRVEGKQRP